MRSDHVTPDDIKQLATELGIIYDGDQGCAWFDLDTEESAQIGLHGTYQHSKHGIEAAFGDLIRYRDRQQEA